VKTFATSGWRNSRMAYVRRYHSMRSSAPATTSGSVIVASAYTETFRASLRSFPHERASSSVAPESPPVCGGSIVSWTA